MERRHAIGPRSPAHAGVLRVGGIDYLNARPLVCGLEGDGDPPLAVSDHHPGRLASMLREGSLDVALVPVVAYPERPDYRILPGIAISSYGAVWSIRLYHRRPLDDVRCVGLDHSSRTSALLTRLLFLEEWGGRPSFLRAAPRSLLGHVRGASDPAGRARAEREPSLESVDAVLLIGDAALECEGGSGWEYVDLGIEWTRLTGLPFVYAFWVVRASRALRPLPPGVVERFLDARDRGLARIDDLVGSASLPPGITTSDARRYLTHVIHYDLREDKLEGLHLFFRKLGEAGLLDVPGEPLRFVDAPSVVGA